MVHRDRAALQRRDRDGSVHDETAVFSQQGVFRLLSDHLLQKGPSFPRPVEVSVDGTSGRITASQWDDAGKEKVTAKRLDLPSDVANGLVLALVKNLSPEVSATTVSMVAATPGPRLVKLTISPAGTDSFAIGRSAHRAVRYRIRLSGLTALLAPLAGKMLAETDVWYLEGRPPAFVKSEGPLYFGGPVWRIELTSPTWPQEQTVRAISR